MGGRITRVIEEAQLQHKETGCGEGGRVGVGIQAV